jgi:hypothetical protein
VIPSCFMRRPCAGQAKESGSHCQLFLPAGPLRPDTSHGNVSVRMRCQRSELAHHSLRGHVVAVSRTERFRPYCGKLCVGCAVVARFRGVCGATAYTHFAAWGAHEYLRAHPRASAINARCSVVCCPRPWSIM